MLKETYSSGSYTESTIADGGLSWPTEIAVDGNGNVYFADYFNSRVLKETYSSGSYTQSVIPTGSPLGNTFGVAVDGSGNVYISDVSNTRVLKEDFAGAPPSLSFASTNVGSTSSDSPQTVTVLNFGSAALTAVAPGLTLPADFTLATGSGTPPDCTSSFSLAANASCNLSIDFFPTTTGTLSETLTLTDNSLNASSATQSITLNGTGIGSVGPPPPTTPTITWATPAPITYGTPLNGVQLNAVASVDGTYVYSPVAETIPIVGSDALSVTFYPSDSIDYTTATATVYLTVNQPTTTTTTLALSSALVSSGTVVTFTATVSNGSAVTTGLVTFCDATAAYCENSAIIGTAQLTSAGTAVIKLVPGIGSHSYKAVFGGNTTSLKSTSSAQALVVTGTFPTATAISSSGSAGSYTLTGTVVGTGSASLSPTGTVSFLDTSNGNAVLGSQTLGSGVAALSFANSSTPAVGNEPAAVTVGDFNGDGKADLAVANGSSGTVTVLLGNGDGTFTAAAGSPITVGSRPVSVAVGDFNGDGKADLAVANYGSGTLTVLLGNGDGTFAAAAGSPITVGNNASAVAAGDFNGDGKADLAVANWGDNTVTVLLAQVTETATAAISGVSIPGAGTHNVDASYAGDSNFGASTSSTIPLTGTASQTTPMITWATPAAITYGTALSATQLDANSGGVAGAFVYNPAAGTTPAAGTDTLSVTFTPSDTTDYTTATQTVSLTVNKATPLITWAMPAAITYGTALSSTQLNATASVPGTFVYNPAAGTTPAAGTDTLSVTFTPTDTTDYTTATASVTLTVNSGSRTTPTITWATPAAISSGTALSRAQLNATASVPGTFVYNPLAGSIPATGTDTLSVTFTPTDTTDNTTTTATVVLTVGDFFGLNSTGLSSQMVAPGGAAVYTLTVQPKGMATLPGVVTFSATGLPPGATAVFSPTTIPAGSTTTAVTLTIQTSALLTKNARTRGLAALGMMLLPLFGMISSRKRARRVRYLLAVVLLGVFSLGTVMGLAGCAGGSGGNQPPLSSTTYTIVVTATCGKLQHATNLTLVVHN